MWGHSGRLRGSSGPGIQASDPCPHRLVDAQNAHMWMASVVIGIEMMPTQIGGDVRAQLLFQPHPSTHARPSRVA